MSPTGRVGDCTKQNCDETKPVMSLSLNMRLKKQTQFHVLKTHTNGQTRASAAHKTFFSHERTHLHCSRRHSNPLPHFPLFRFVMGDNTPHRTQNRTRLPCDQSQFFFGAPPLGVGSPNAIWNLDLNDPTASCGAPRVALNTKWLSPKVRPSGWWKQSHYCNRLDPGLRRGDNGAGVTMA